jgi:hypothetical protein
MSGVRIQPEAEVVAKKPMKGSGSDVNAKNFPMILMQRLRIKPDDDQVLIVTRLVITFFIMDEIIISPDETNHRRFLYQQPMKFKPE